jgi:hypothetical protein
MEFRPFLNQAPDASGQKPIQDIQRLNVHYCPVFVVSNMEVWRIVFIEIHADHNSEEAANFRHVNPG